MIHLGYMKHSFRFLNLYHIAVGAGIQRVPDVSSREDHLSMEHLCPKSRTYLHILSHQ